MFLHPPNLKYLLFKSLDARNRHRTRTASIPLLETFYHITRLHHLHVQRYRLFPLFTEPPCFYFTLNACFPPVTRVPYLFSRAVKKKRKKKGKRRLRKSRAGNFEIFVPRVFRNQRGLKIKRESLAIVIKRRERGGEGG